MLARPAVLAIGILLFLAALLAGEEAGRPRVDRHGDPLPDGAIARLGTLRFRPAGRCFPHPDGKKLLTSDGARLHVWDLASGRLLRTIDVGGQRLIDLRFSGDGKLFAAHVDNQGLLSSAPTVSYSLVIGELATGKERHRLKCEYVGFRSFAFLAGGTLLATCDENPYFEDKEAGVQVWDVRTGKVICRLIPWLACEVSPDGKVFATSGKNGTVALWDAESRKQLHRLNGHGMPAHSLAFSPDGRTLAIVYGSPPQAPSTEPKTRPAPSVICLWDVRTGKERRRLTSGTGQLDEPVFSADGRKLIARNDAGTLFCWDVVCGELSFCLPGTKGHSIPYALVPNGRSLVWSERNVLREIRLEDGRVLRRWEIDDRDLSQLVFARDGKSLITWGEGVRIWDFDDGKERLACEAHRKPVIQTIFSDDGRSLVSRDSSGVVRRWEVPSGKPLSLGDGRPGRAVRILSLDGGKSFLSIGEDLTARVLDLGSGKVVREFVLGTPATIHRWRELNPARIWSGLDDEVRERIVLSPDGRTLAMINETGGIDLWDTGSGKRRLLIDGKMGQCSRLLFAADGNSLVALVAFSDDEMVRVWALPPGELRYKGKCKGLFDLSPDGKTIALETEQKGTLLLWDVAQRKERVRLPIHEDGLAALAFGPGGRTVAAGCRFDRTIQLWDTATGRELHRIVGVEAEQFTMRLRRGPHGHFVAEVSLGGKNSRTELRDILTGRTIGPLRCRGEDYLLSPDGRTLVTGGHSLVFREMLTGTEVRAVEGVHDGSLWIEGFSPDGRLLATAGYDTTILLWDWQRLCGLNGQRRGARDRSELWSTMTSEKASIAYPAMGAFRAEPCEAVAFLSRHLGPITERDAESVRRLLRGLDSRRFAERQRASSELMKLSMDWEPLLRGALDNNPSLELRRRLETILESPSIRQWSPDMLRRLRAVQLLEMIASPEAEALLEKVASGLPEAKLTQEAKATLQRSRSLQLSRERRGVSPPVGRRPAS